MSTPITDDEPDLNEQTAPPWVWVVTWLLVLALLTLTLLAGYELYTWLTQITAPVGSCVVPVCM